MSSRKRRTYSKELKAEILERVASRKADNTTIKLIAAEFGVSVANISNWLSRKDSTPTVEPKTHSSDEEEYPVFDGSEEEIPEEDDRYFYGEEVPEDDYSDVTDDFQGAVDSDWD